MESVLGLVRHPGNDALFRGIEMSLLATLAGQPLHIHAEGLRGTGKTTIMRAVRRALPRIRRIKGCLYNCDPAAPHCPVHRGLSHAQAAALGEEWVPMPFLEISHSAKVGTVVGSIDLGRLVSPSQPEAALLPGTIPQAHRGIIFVDEINRLAETSPELADVLLDVMGTKPGRVQIEETGLPAVELPVQVSVWAASNPDEDPGPLEEIRRQLSDRFDFAVYTDRPGDTEIVEQILAMAERSAHRPSPLAETQAELWRTRLSLRAAELRKVELEPGIRQQIAGLYSRFELESLRAVQAIQAGIRLSACLNNRHQAVQEDLHRVVPMALRHRVDPETIRKVSAYLAGGAERADGQATGQRSRFPGLSFGGVLAEAAQAIQPSPPLVSESGRLQPILTPPLHGRPLAPPVPSPLAGQNPAAKPSPPAGPNPAAKPSPLAGLNPAAKPSPPAGPPRSAQPGATPAAGGPSGASGVTPGALPGSDDGDSWLRRTLSQLGLSRPGDGGASPQPRPALDRFGRQGAASGPGRMNLPDPKEHPPSAPPHAARPLSSLRPEEWVRTEEELGRS